MYLHHFREAKFHKTFVEDVPAELSIFLQGVEHVTPVPDTLLAQQRPPYFNTLVVILVP